MLRQQRFPFLLAAIALPVVAGLGLVYLLFAATGGMDAMSVDMNVSGNSATSLGTHDFCVQVSAGATVTADVTAYGIPSSHAMIAYAYTLSYNPSALSVTGQDPNFLLASAPGSTIFNAGDPRPDTDGNFQASVADLNTNATESGSGVLDRLTIKVASNASNGRYTLALSSAGHIDGSNNDLAPDVTNNGTIAVGVSCGPTPTPHPHARGDVDCSGEVSSIDALKILRHVAGSAVSLPPGCSFAGDIDCSNSVDSVDALKLLRYVAGLSVSLPPSCPPIGP